MCCCDLGVVQNNFLQIALYWTILGTQLSPCFILSSQVVLMQFHPIYTFPNVIQNHGAGVKKVNTFLITCKIWDLEGERSVDELD